ncbi:MAG: hypothetical protein C4321_09370, partial [Chloroflexota bacterium]
PDVAVWLSGPGDASALLAAAPPEARARTTVLPLGEPTAQHERYGRAWVTTLPSRGDSFGMVLVESLACGTPIVAAADHDYVGFYAQEIAHRRRAGYPPFSRLVRLVYQHPNLEAGLAEASRVATELRVLRDAAGRAEPDILGPARPFIPRRRGEYRWQILLRGRQPAALVANVRLGERWRVDVDPGTLL